MPSRRSCASLLLLALLASCSPDNQPTGPVNLTGVPFTISELAGTTLGVTGPVVTTNSQAALISGIPGQFTSLRFIGTAGASATPSIYFAMGLAPAEFTPNIWRIGLNGSGIRRVTSDTQPQRYPSASPDGSPIAFFQTIAELGHAPLQDIIRVQRDGSGRTRIGTSIDSRDPVAWTARGDSIYFNQNDPFSVGMWRQPNLLVNAEQLTNEEDGQPAIAILDSVPTLLFSRSGRLMRMNLATRDTTVFFANGATLSQPRVSPDGQRLLFIQQDSGVVTGAPFQIRAAALTSPGNSKLLAMLPLVGLLSLPSAAWSIDSRHVVATLQPGPNLPAQLYDLDADAASSPNGVPRRLITTLSGTLFPGLSVGPPAPAQSRPLIGPGAPLGETASGIVLGQRAGGALASLVAFGAVSADSVELTAPTGLNSTAPVLSVSLRADRLTSLAFINDPSGPVTQVIDSTSGATGALVTFDAATGSVALVLPFAIAPGEQVPTVRDEGNRRVFRGRFLAVIGAEGVRAGPAVEVVFDHTRRTIRTR